MTNPHADLEKLEKAYTADPAPKCWCGSPMLLDNTYGDGSETWQCIKEPNDRFHDFNYFRNAGDPGVLIAVEEIRYLRQLVLTLRDKMCDAHRIIGETLYETRSADALKL